MMRRRFLLATELVIALEVLAVVVYVLLPSGLRVTKANFDRIQDGMSVTQVEARLGPLDEESFLPLQWGILYTGKILSGHTRKVWAGADGAARIDFVEDNRVAAKVWVDAQNSFFDRVRRWLRRLPI